MTSPTDNYLLMLLKIKSLKSFFFFLMYEGLKTLNNSVTYEKSEMRNEE